MVCHPTILEVPMMFKLRLPDSTSGESKWLIMVKFIVYIVTGTEMTDVSILIFLTSMKRSILSSDNVSLINTFIIKSPEIVINRKTIMIKKSLKRFYCMIQ